MMEKKEKQGARLLHNKDFVLLFLGGLVSRIGDGIHYVALVWLVLELTGSGTATGMLLLLATLPGVLISPFGGVIADRFSRKFLIVSMDFLRGIITLWLGWVVYTSSVDFIHLAVATVLIAICSSFFNPAVSATLPNLVKDSNLQQATSLDHFSASVTQVIGAAIGGILIALMGTGGVFIVNGISFILSGFSEMFINVPKLDRKGETGTTIVSDLKVGARYIFNHKDIFYLFVIALFLNLVGTGTLMVGLPYAFKEILQVGSKMFGIAQSIFPAGAFIGALALSFYQEIKNYYRVLIFGFAAESFLCIFFAIPLLPLFISQGYVIQIYYILVSIILIFGVINALVNVPIKVILMRLIPDNLRGRVFGLLSTLSQSMVPISMAVVGFMLDLIPAYSIFLVSGILSLVLTVIAARVPELRELGKTNEGDGLEVEMVTN